MYQKISDKVADVSLGLITAMSKEQALKELSLIPQEEILKALAEQRKQLQTGKSALDERIAAGSLKQIITLLSVLVPAALSYAGGIDDLQLQIKKAPLTEQTAETIERDSKADAKANVQKTVADIKNKIKTTKGGKPVTAPPTSVGGEKVQVRNEGQGSMLAEISKLDRTLAGLVASGTMAANERTKIIGELTQLVSAIN